MRAQNTWNKPADRQTNTQKITKIEIHASGFGDKINFMVTEGLLLVRGRGQKQWHSLLKLALHIVICATESLRLLQYHSSIFYYNYSHLWCKRFHIWFQENKRGKINLIWNPLTTALYFRVTFDIQAEPIQWKKWIFLNKQIRDSVLNATVSESYWNNSATVVWALTFFAFCTCKLECSDICASDIMLTWSHLRGEI